MAGRHAAGGEGDDTPCYGDTESAGLSSPAAIRSRQPRGNPPGVAGYRVIKQNGQGRRCGRSAESTNLKTFVPPVGRTLPPLNRTQTESAAAKAARQERAKFYSSRVWRRTAAAQLGAFPLCCWCNRLATMVDHIIPRLDAPDIAFDPSNLRSCCRACHSTHGKKANH